MKKFNLICFLILCSSLNNFLHAQQNQISGVVTDTAGNLLDHASVSIHNCTDSLLINFMLTDKKGAFHFKTDKDSIILSISYIGFKTFIRKLSGLSRKSFLLEKVALEVTDNILDEVKIDAFVPPIQFKKDTLIFNATAFKTSKIEVVNDLLTKLPGVTVNNGVVKVNGRTVSRILVDGREFFGNNRNILLNTFPADAIENVKVYDSPGDVMKNISPNQRSKDISLTLKKNKKKGVFGNLIVSAGPEKNYFGKSSVNYFDRTVQLSTEFSNDNINNQGIDVEAKSYSQSQWIDNYGAEYGMNGLSSIGSDDGIITTGKKGFFTEVALGKLFLSTSESGLVGGSSSANQHRLGVAAIVYNRSMEGGGRTSQLWNNNDILNETFQDINRKADKEKQFFLSYKFIPVKQVEWKTYFTYATNNGNENMLQNGIRNYVNKSVILYDSTTSTQQIQSFTIKSNVVAQITKKKSITMSFNSSNENRNGRNDNFNSLENFVIDTLLFVRKIIKQDRIVHQFVADYTDLIDSQFTLKVNVTSNMEISKNKTPAFLFNPVTNLFDSISPTMGNFFKTKAFNFSATPELNYDAGRFQFSGAVSFEKQQISVDEPTLMPAINNTYNYVGTALSATVQNPLNLPFDLGVNSGTSQTPPSSAYINPYLDVSNPLLQVRGKANLTPEKNKDFGFTLTNHSSKLNFPLINLNFDYTIISDLITETITEPTPGIFLTEYLNSPDKSNSVTFSAQTSKYHYDIKKGISRTVSFTGNYEKINKFYFFNTAKFRNSNTNFSFSGQFIRNNDKLFQFYYLNYTLYQNYSSLQSTGKFSNQSLQGSYTMRYKITPRFNAEAFMGYNYFFLQNRKNIQTQIVNLKAEYVFKKKPMTIGIKASDIFNKQRVFDQSFNGLSFSTMESVVLRRYCLFYFSWQIKNLKKN